MRALPVICHNIDFAWGVEVVPSRGLATIIYTMGFTRDEISKYHKYQIT